TDSHLVLADARPVAEGLDGPAVEKVCDEIGIAINKNQVPFDPAPPLKPSGIRVGSPGPCTWGMGPDQLTEIGHLIGEASKNVGDEVVKKNLKERVLDLVSQFPAYP
ncbi:MAG: serine hydroxymethyltransferase, partial [Actinomycetota bacterium]